LSNSCQKVVKKLSKSCQKVVKYLSKSCQKVAIKLAKIIVVKKLVKILKRVGGEEREEKGDL
jgi:hypothetical protein